MKEKTCRHCGDTVVLAERGETVVNGQTPIEHLEETGHAWNAPTVRVCNECGHVWPYTGRSERPTCPTCNGKNTDAAK